jgi:uncharacterized phage-associated protein
MSEKTRQFLTFIVQKYPRIPITSLMKLSYLIDLANIKRNGKKISDFDYIRYKHGPFDSKIYDYLKDLIEKNILIQDIQLSLPEDYYTYEFNDDKEDFSISKISEKEKMTIVEVINSLQGMGAKVLTQIAYKTKPMKKLGAELDNLVGLNEKLDLNAN